MARKYEDGKLEQLYKLLEKNPGVRAALLAELLGCQRSAVTRALPALEEEGFLVSEDERGGLWPFRQKDQ